MSDTDSQTKQTPILSENTDAPDHGAALEEVVSQKVMDIEKLEPPFQAARDAVKIDKKALDVVMAAKESASDPAVVSVYELAIKCAQENLQTDVLKGMAVQERITATQTVLSENLAELKIVKPESPLAALAEAA